MNTHYSEKHQDYCLLTPFVYIEQHFSQQSSIATSQLNLFHGHDVWQSSEEYDLTRDVRIATKSPKREPRRNPTRNPNTKPRRNPRKRVTRIKEKSPLDEAMTEEMMPMGRNVTKPMIRLWSRAWGSRPLTPKCPKTTESPRRSPQWESQQWIQQGILGRNQ